MSENPITQHDPATGESIDDVLEAGRDVERGDPLPGEAAGTGFDRTVRSGAEDTAAAEQGNRDEDEMSADASGIEDAPLADQPMP